MFLIAIVMLQIKFNHTIYAVLAEFERQGAHRISTMQVLDSQVVNEEIITYCIGLVCARRRGGGAVRLD